MLARSVGLRGTPLGDAACGDSQPRQVEAF